MGSYIRLSYKVLVTYSGRNSFCFFKFMRNATNLHDQPRFGYLAENIIGFERV